MLWLCFNKGLIITVQRLHEANICQLLQLDHWPSGNILTTTGSSTYRLLTEIQEPIANRAISPWVTAALLHQLPHMVPLTPAKRRKECEGEPFNFVGHKQYVLPHAVLTWRMVDVYAKFPPLWLPSLTSRKFLSRLWNSSSVTDTFYYLFQS